MFTIVIDAAGGTEEMPVSGFHGQIGRDRFFEGTDSRLREWLNTFNEEDRERHLISWPVLWSPEHEPNETSQLFAYVGRFDRLRVDDREVRYTFKPYENFAPIPVQRLQELNEVFNFGPWGWHRTKIVAMEEDIFDVLGADISRSEASEKTVCGVPVPDLFNIGPKRYEKLVCVMMPFTLPTLGPVFAKIDEELTHLGIYCQRADTHIGERRVIDKVATLIYNADAVICDFTSTNANVFYEAGLAHAWSKKTIFIAETGTKLPFDTADEDTIFYENTEIGLKQLWYRIRQRLRAQTELIEWA